MRPALLRRSLLTSVVVFVGTASPAWGESAVDRPLFSRHVVPLLSRLGCNAGTCHGAVQGQNGFRLSLFGAEPGQDHLNLLRDNGGRRLNRFDPASSLLLLKATGQLPHQGGKRLHVGTDDYRLLLNWLTQGATLDRLDVTGVTQLKITPGLQTLQPDAECTLRVEATFADGSTEDVSSLSTFEAVDKDVAEVDAKGRVRARGVGDTSLVVRYGADASVALVLVPRPGKEPFPETKATNVVDEQVLAKLRRLNVPPSDRCDDATFLRRVCLDVTGALPTPDEVRKFLADADADKRVKKIDELVARPGYAALWATRYCDILKASGFNANYAMLEPAEDRRFYEWLRARFQENLPYDQLAERILLATSREGRSHEEWLGEVMVLAQENARQAADLPTYARRKTLDLYWQREGATGLKGTLQVAHAFLGLRLECAQCHRHPHDVWKQDDLLSFANFFMRVKGANYPDAKRLPPMYAEMFKKAPNEAKQLTEQAKKLSDKLKDKNLPANEVEKIKAEAEALQMKARMMTDGPKRFGTDVCLSDRATFASVSSPLGSQKSEQYRLLGEKEVVKVPLDKDPRELVVAWMRRANNPFFARAAVNRVWAHYFGRGLVDPADHLSPLNPPSHPELLKALSDGFVQQKYDLKWLHRTILNSQAYQRSCRPTPANRSDRRNYSYFYLRRLPAEVIVDAVNHATGSEETYPARLFVPPGAKAIEVPGTTGKENEFASLAYAFQVFGRPARNAQIQCDCERDGNTTIVQALYLANHPRVRAKIASPNGRLARIVKDIPDDKQRVEEVFLWTVSRPPTGEERETCLKYLKDSSSPDKGLEDVMWGLLNTREFLLNH